MSRFRLALIKQDVYADLYYGESGDTKPYLNSLQRSGPMALFVAFDVDLFIVSADETSDVWMEKVTCCGHKSFEEWERVRSREIITAEGHRTSQQRLAIAINEIPFNEYDIVIAMDACIPAEVTQKFTTPLWAYYISEPCMDVYKKSKTQCLAGYDIFLNQMFRHGNDVEYESSDDTHQIDFPYSFVYPYLYDELLDIGRPTDPVRTARLRIAIPGYVRKILSAEQLGAIAENFDLVTPGGKMVQFLASLASCHIYLRVGNQGKFGNETVESVCAGNLFLSTERGWKNRVFNICESVIDGDKFDDEQFDCAMERLKFFDVNRHEIQRIGSEQRLIAQELCFDRPLSQLKNKIHLKTLNSGRRANDNLHIES